MYLYKTMFLPLYLIGLILIAGSFTIKFTKTKARIFFLILTGTVTGFLIHVLTETIYSLGIANKLPTLLASLSPSIITIMIGVFFVIHFEKTN
jgi:lipopolysaccharide export LptBFGC system permease protein LptF